MFTMMKVIFGTFIIIVQDLLRVHSYGGAVTFTNYFLLLIHERDIIIFCCFMSITAFTILANHAFGYVINSFSMYFANRLLGWLKLCARPRPPILAACNKGFTKVLSKA